MKEYFDTHAALTFWTICTLVGVADLSALIVVITRLMDTFRGLRKNQPKEQG